GHGAVGLDYAGTTTRGEFGEDVLDPGVVGIVSRWHPIAPAGVFFITGPVFDVERRVGHDVIGLHIRVLIAGKGVSPAWGKVGVEPVDGQVHFGHPPGTFIEFLAVNGDRGAILIMGVEELLGLDKHATGSATGVIDAAAGWLKNFNQDADDICRSVEFAAALTFRPGEFLQEILIDLAEEIACSAWALTGEPGGVE